MPNQPLAARAPREPFEGTARYRVEGVLGSGNFGTVYRVYDLERDLPLALKVLSRTDPAARYRFKREFRALADVSHPNLVALHELAADGDRLLLTMELVPGVDFLEHVRPEGLDVLESVDSDSFERASRSERDRRLRSALRQLVEGLGALHQAGHLHRDLKPANVLVTPDDRVVILDFGLVAELIPGQMVRSADIGGSPAYMAPEQAADAPVGAASDWYAVGVMLFEALTGQLPFEGRALHVMVQKQTREAPPVTSLAPDAPADLAELCQALLQRDPKDRPDLEALRERLADAHRPPPLGVSSPRPAAAAIPFVGRADELRLLHEALDGSRTGHATVVLLHGASGMGKSLLAQRFVREAAHAGATVLRGRCYEQESVAYKGVDSVVDAASKYLRALEEEEARTLCPGEIGCLVRLFPVLEQVRPFAEIAHWTGVVPDRRELRRRAFGALRELLTRIAARQPLVIAVDDVQWGDADSAMLLREVLRPPNPPPLLLLISYRTDDASRSPFLDTLLPLHAPAGTLTVREIALRELSTEQAAALARGSLIDPDEEQALRIARESGGSPFFVEELVRFAQSGMASTSPSLEQALLARVSLLSESGQRLLRALAVAGQPLDRDVCRAAAHIEGDEVRLVASLRSAHLLRSRRGHSGRTSLEIYHDRIRETLLAAMGEGARRSVHSELALALAQSQSAEPETLAFHLEGAGETGAAAAQLAIAAQRAFDAFAWDRAARLWRRALDLDPALPEARTMRERLGDALSNAGRGGDAAAAYLEAAEGMPSALALELRRRATEQLLRSGRMEDGYRALDEVLREVGLRLHSPRRALLSLIAGRARLKLRGLRFTEQRLEDVPQEVLQRIDVTWSAGVGLGNVDSIRGAEFLTHSLLDALAAGEPFRVARSLAYEAAFTSNAGAPAARRAADLVRRTEALAERLDHPHLRGLAAASACVTAFHAGRFREAIEQGRRAETLFRDRCTNVVKEIVSVQLFQLVSLLLVGRMEELAERVPRYVHAAEERGDRYALTNLRSGLPNAVWLAADDPAGARLEAERAMAGWSREPFLLQHYFDCYAHAQIDMYEGRPLEALVRLDEVEPLLERSLLFRIQMLRVLHADQRARAAIGAAACSGSQRRVLLKSAERAAARLEREAALGWSRPLALVARAGIAAMRGEGGVDSRLAEAAAGFEANDLLPHAAAARRARALHSNRPAAVAAQDAVLRGLGIAAPARWAALLVPLQS